MFAVNKLICASFCMYSLFHNRHLKAKTSRCNLDIFTGGAREKAVGGGGD